MLGLISVIEGLLIYAGIFIYILIPVFMLLDLAAEAREHDDNVPLVVLIGIFLYLTTFIIGLWLYSWIYSMLNRKPANHQKVTAQGPPSVETPAVPDKYH